MSTVRNAGWNIASAVVPMAVSLLTIPPYLALIGEERYGVLAILLSLMGYFGLFDLGLSAATEQQVAAAPPDDVEARRAIVWTALATNSAMGLLAGLLCVPVAWFFLGDVAKGTEGFMGEIVLGLPWLILALPLTLARGVLRGALLGAGRFGELAIASILGAAVAQLLPLAAAWLIAPRLDVLIPVATLGQVAVALPMVWLLDRHVTHGLGWHFDRARLGKLLHFGGWVTVTAIVGPLMTSLDRFLIASTLGPRPVSHYTIPYTLAQRGQILPTGLVQALFPRVAASSAEDRVALGIRTLRASNAVMLPAVIAGIFLVEPFLALWINREFALAAGPTARILLCGFWINSLGICCMSQLYASGKPKLAAIAHCIELVPYLLVLAACLYGFGLPGAAAAFTLRVLADDLILGAFAGLAGEIVRIFALAAPLVGFSLWFAGDSLAWTLAPPLAIAALWSLASLRRERAALKTAFQP